MRAVRDETDDTALVKVVWEQDAEEECGAEGMVEEENMGDDTHCQLPCFSSSGGERKRPAPQTEQASHFQILLVVRTAGRRLPFHPMRVRRAAVRFRIANHHHRRRAHPGT